MIRADQDEFQKFQGRLEGYGLDRVSEMILNQPILTASAVWRDRDDFIGANARSASACIEWGRNNFNRFMKRYRQLVAQDADTTLADALKTVNNEAGLFSAERLALSVTYRETDDLDYTYDYVESVTDPGTGVVSSFDRTATVILDEGKELCASFLWSHTMKSQEVELNGIMLYPRVDVSLEYVDISDDSM